MTDGFRATFSGPDPSKIMAALLKSAPFAKDPPKHETRNLQAQPPSKGWKQQLLAADQAVVMEWSDVASIGCMPPVCQADLPDLPLDPEAVVAFLAGLPIHLAVMPAHTPDWKRGGYRLPKVGAGHAGVGWGIAFKGDGHDQHVVSRRWLECGPFRLLRGPHDTTLVQFCDLDADSAAALTQAKPGHEWMSAGFLMTEHRYDTEVEGLYTPKDGLLRIVINDRKIPDKELLDGCAARRDRAEDRKQPIKNLAYIFVDETEARANLERLWLRGLECRVANGKGERRIDTNYTPKMAKPAWV